MLETILTYGQLYAIPGYGMSAAIVAWYAIRTLYKEGRRATWGLLLGMMLLTFVPIVNSIGAVCCLPEMFSGMFGAIGRFLDTPILPQPKH